MFLQLPPLTPLRRNKRYGRSGRQKKSTMDWWNSNVLRIRTWNKLKCHIRWETARKIHHELPSCLFLLNLQCFNYIWLKMLISMNNLRIFSQQWMETHTKVYFLLSNLWQFCKYMRFIQMETQLLSYFDITWQDTKHLSLSPTKSFPLKVQCWTAHIIA